MARCLFSTLRLRVLFSQEIVPHFVYLLNPFLSVFPCKKAKSCFSKSFCRLARRWPRFPFARIPIFNALCLFFVLVPYSHLLEFPFARERTVCYRATDSAYLEDYRSSTASFVGRHEIRKPDGVQIRWSSGLVNNARLVVMVVGFRPSGLVTFMPLYMYYTMA